MFRSDIFSLVICNIAAQDHSLVAKGVCISLILSTNEYYAKEKQLHEGNRPGCKEQEITCNYVCRI